MQSQRVVTPAEARVQRFCRGEAGFAPTWIQENESFPMEGVVLRIAKRCLSIVLSAGCFLAALTPYPAFSAPLAYVTNPLDAGKVVVVDTATNATVGSPISVGGQPIGIAMNPAGTRLYVANSASNNVSVIDTGTNTSTATIPVGLVPWGIAVNPSGTGYVYVANIGSNTVSVINPATNTVIKNIGVGHDPVGVAVNPAGTRAYVTCSRYDINSVYIINTESDTAVGHLVLETFPYAVAVSPDGSCVYVTNRDSNSVSIIDATVPVVIKTIVVGASPVGIVVAPDGSRAYVVNGGADTVSVINTATNTVTGSPIAVGSGASSIAISGTRVYVGNYSGHSISVIDTATNQVVNTINLETGVWPALFGLVVEQTQTGDPPTVVTDSLSNVTATTASGGGNVTSDGGAAVTARGVCWSTTASPTTADSHTSDGTGTGSFASSLTGLAQATAYHVRAYATNAVGTSYGADLTFSTDAILSVTIQGAGSGAVHSSAPDINCTGGVCSQSYSYGASVTLSAAAGLRSAFGGWQGSCSNPSGDCTVTMDAVRAVLATFNVNPAYGVWIDPGTNYYGTIGEAYQAAGASATIKACQLEVTEELDLNLGKTITLSGGWDSSYASNSGLTTVKGTMTIGSGAVSVGNIALK